MNHTLVFQLNADLTIMIDLHEPLHYVDYSYQAEVYVAHNQHKYAMGRDTVYYTTKRLRNLLFNALSDTTQLHASINQDIGYLYNQELQGKPGLVYDQDNEYSSWVGYRYYLWGVDLIAWIYNDANQEIIFEITPAFPGEPTYFYKDEPLSPAAVANSAWYEEWITNYKPLLKTTIPRSTAQQWLDQADAIVKCIDQNTNRMCATNSSH